MSKKRFIQHASAIMLFNTGTPPCVDKAISYAERLWDKLAERGYGSAKEHQPRNTQDYYAALNPQQQKHFKVFWHAFNHKHGRNGAAMRWGQLGALTPPQYQLIIDAAAKEANRQLPYGQVRIMAQGWLEEKRYNDYTPTATKKASKKTEKINMANELASLKQLHKAMPSDSMAKRIKEIEGKLT